MKRKKIGKFVFHDKNTSRKMENLKGGRPGSGGGGAKKLETYEDREMVSPGSKNVNNNNHLWHININVNINTYMRTEKW